MRKLLIILLLLCILIGVAVYFSSSKVISANTNFHNEIIQINIASDQAPALMMRESNFHITLSDLAGNPLSGQQLEVTFSMPGMLCGTFPATVAESQPGTYIATGIPVMQGDWQAEVSVHTNKENIKVAHSFKVKP